MPSRNQLWQRVVALTGREATDLQPDFTMTLLDVAHLVVLVLDLDRRIVYANEFLERITGYSLEELEGRDWFEACLTPETATEVAPVFDRAIHGTPTTGYVNAIKTRDGGRCVVEWYDRTLSDADGNVVGLVAIGHDVTQRADALDRLHTLNEQLEARIAERTAELSSSEVRYRGLLETLDECIYRMSLPDGAYEYMGPAAESVFGYPAQAFLERPGFIFDIISEESREDAERNWRDLRRGEVPRTYSYKVRQPDGSERWILQSNKGIFDANGNLVAIEGICRDVTREQQAQHALERNVQLLEGSFDASTVTLAYLDRDMRFLRVNEAYARADGKTPEFFVGKNHFDLYPHAENQRIFERVRDTGEPHSEIAKPFEYTNNPERGVTHWDWTLTPVKREDGFVTGLVLALRDVTERVNAIEALKESERRITEELAEKKVLLSEVHHRVKNNLQVISSLLYLQSTQTKDPAVTRLFDASRKRVRAMALVHETLYESGELGRVDFGPYLRTLARALHSSYSESSGVVIETIVTAPPLSIEKAVPCALVASELMTNALKYAFVGRDRGTVRVTLSETNGIARLRVRDDGVGLDPTCIESPTTLGLTLIRTLAEQLQGAVTLNSDGGAEFSIEFPIEHPATSSPPPAPTKATDVSGPRM